MECITKENTMNIKMLKAALAGLILSVSSFANAGLITFDDVTPNSFQDTTFNDFTLYEGSVGDWSTNYGIHEAYSGTQNMVNHNGNGFGLLTYNLGTFDFISAFFHQDNRVPSRAVTSLFGLDENGNTIYSTNITTTNDWTKHSFSWTGITSLKWTASSANIGIDDFEYSVADASVPEPSTLAIFALGIMGLASRRFKKQ